MTNKQYGFVSLAIGALTGAMLSNNPLRAEDIEIYTAALSGGFDEHIRPNILYVIDTSGSMDGNFYVNPEDWYASAPTTGKYSGLSGPYDSAKDYSALGTCDKNVVYYRELSSSEVQDHDGEPDTLMRPWLNEDGYPVKAEGSDEINLPGCGSLYFPKAALACAPALAALGAGDKGWYHDYFGSFWPAGDDLGGREMDGEWHNFLASGHRGTAVYNSLPLWRECAADLGLHGDPFAIDPAAFPFPNADAGETGTIWTDDSSKKYTSHTMNNHYLVADGNFLNWFYHVQTRMAAVQTALRDVINELPGETNVGLMRFDSANYDAAEGGDAGTDGGMMIKEFVTLGEGTNRESFIKVLFSISPNAMSGSTPLAETLYEAFLVFAGEKAYFGAASEDDSGALSRSVSASLRDSKPDDPADSIRYKSPITESCQQNSVIYFTDGKPTSDVNAFQGIGRVDAESNWLGGFDALPGIPTVAPDSPYAPISPYFYATDPATDGFDAECNSASDEIGCLPTLAAYMRYEDVNLEVPGEQNVTTHTIGFLSADSDTVNPDYLQLAAQQGGGTFKLVSTADELRDAFKIMTRKAVSANTAFTAPALAVNAFNQTRDQDEVLFAMFKSANTPGWKGNLKMYRFMKNTAGELYLADADGEPAIVPETGLFAHDARSIWSLTPDGNEVPDGGAAGNLPATRNLRTWFGNMSDLELNSDGYVFASSNAAITQEMLGMDGSELTYTRADVIDWLRGMDVRDEDGDGITSEQRLHMGDPLHSRPVIVTYGESETDPDQKVFVTTNDGFLHMIDMDTGVEEFGFVAQETLKNAKRMYESDATAGKAYGLDGGPVLWIEEGATRMPGIGRNGDTDDHAYLYVGMRRGGRSYHAFDFTDPTRPKILWQIKGGDLDGDGVFDAEDEPFYYLGQTWSTPQLGEVKINNVVTKVLVFAGGFDPNQDDPDGNPGTTEDTFDTDTYGNAVYIVNAETGERLWWAGSDAAADLKIDEMRNSIPSDVSLVDMDGDGWSDRIYVADTAARLFRIDITEFSGASGIEASGGMIADLGATAVTDDPTTLMNERTRHNRKAFYPIDVVVVENGSQDYVALAFGTGARNHPANPIEDDTPVEDIFFVVRDPNILNKPLSNNYNYGITLDSLYDATDNDLMATNVDGTADTTTRDAARSEMNSKKGWYIRMEREGEKVLAPAITFNYQTMFTTFEPQDLDLATCQARTGIGRVYVVDLRDATPTQSKFHTEDGDEPDELTTEDRSYELRRDGIPSAIVIPFPEANDGESAPMAGTELPPIDTGRNRRKAYWYVKEQ